MQWRIILILLLKKLINLHNFDNIECTTIVYTLYLSEQRNPIVTSEHPAARLAG